MTHQGGPRTPDFKRSNRILVPSSHSRANGSFSSGISSSNFSSNSGGTNEPPLFIPKRRSFGIVIKAHDPDRIPARARRSRSRSRSGSRSRSVSVSSLTSALNRAKSRSLGDIDMEGESIVEEEVDRRRSKDINRQQSFRNLSSSPRRRSLSRRSMGSEDSRTSSDMVKSSIDVSSSKKTMRRQRSNELSNPKIPTHNDSVIRRDSSLSQSTLVVNYRLDNHSRQESKKEQNRGRTREIETRSRAAQYEIVQQKKLPSENNAQQEKLSQRVDNKNQNSSTSNQQFAVIQQNTEANAQGRHNIAINDTQINGQHIHNSSLQDSRTHGQHHQMSMHSSEDKTNSNFPQRRLHHQISLSSDEGTDLDDLPWGRAEDLLLASMDTQANRNEPHNTSKLSTPRLSASPINRSYMGSRNIGSPYTNIEEMQPMLPPKNLPKLPPKISTQHQHVNQFSNVLHHNRQSSKENVHSGQIPPTLPARSFSPRIQTGQLQEHFNNGPLSPSWPNHPPANRGPLSPQQHCCENQVGVQGFPGSNQINAPIHPHDQPLSRSGWSHSASHAAPCCNESFHSQQLQTPGCPNHHSHCAQMNCSTRSCNGMHDQVPQAMADHSHGNEHSLRDSHAVTGVGKISHQISSKFHRADPPPQSFERPRTVNFTHGSPKSNVHAENIALLNSRRQFKSTANFQSAGLLPARQNMQRAKSTDALSVGGLIRSDPEVGNLDAAVKSKKTKSRIVLDDISLSSLEEFQGKSNKPKLSEEPKRGKLEMWSGLLHFFTICSCLLTTVTLALVSNHWDRYAHKCPLYVTNNLQHDRYWGNPSMVPCYISAYLPLLVIVISVGLVFVHGGLLVFWRSGRKSSSYYMTRSFGVTVTFFNIVALAVALAVACVLTDGLRQTCLSFMLVTDYNFRPVNCQMGFDSLDLNYNMEGTLYLIIFGIIGAWISVIFTLISVVMYTIRAGCCRCKLH